MGKNNFVAIILSLAVIAGVSAAGVERPVYNWDLLAYMGLIADSPNATDGQVHGAVYDEARRKMPPANFAELTDPNPNNVRADVYRNPQFFREQLGWYRQRPLFTLIGYAFHSAGLPLLRSVQVAAGLGFLGLNLMFLTWAVKYLSANVGGALSCLVCLNFWPVARLGTPDTMFAFSLLLAIYLLIEGCKPILCCCMLAASILVRSDGALLALGILFYAAFLADSERRLRLWIATLFAVLFVAEAFMISRFSGHYGWTALMYHSFFGGLADPVHFRQTLSLKAYLKLLAAGLSSIPNSGVLAYIITFVVAWYAVVSRSLPRQRRFYLGLLACVSAGLAVRYLIFPSVTERHILPLSYLLIILAVRLAIEVHPKLTTST
jgi:hypothetical protein